MVKYLVYIGTPLVALLLLTSCPVSTSIPLESKGKELIDSSILGIWMNDSADTEVKEVQIRVNDQNSYKVNVIKKGSSFMSESDSFRAWITSIGEIRYLVLQEYENNKPKDTYYAYEVSMKGKNLITHDFSLKVEGTDAITSIARYRLEVFESSKLSGFLSAEIVWYRKL